MMVLVAWICRRARHNKVDKWFRRLQLVSAGAYSLVPLHYAARGGPTDMICLLVNELGADVNAVGNDGNTPLHDAALVSESVEVVRLLVDEFGADVGAKNHNGHTPLHVAAYCGRVEAVCVLAGECGELEQNLNTKEVDPALISQVGAVRFLTAEAEGLDELWTA